MSRARRTEAQNPKTSARAPSGAPAPASPGPFPPAAAWWRPREPYLVPALLLLATRVFAWLKLPLAAEDAYITFRYSRNLATGNGLVYNSHERVMGFSSPLWAVWNALGIVVTRDPVAWSRATGVAADLVAMVVVARLLERHASRAAAWCFALFFALWPYICVVSVSGLEMPALLALIALAAALADARSAWTGPVLGALALTRPEGLAAAVVIALWARGRDRLVAAVMAALGVGALWAYYGSPVPQSVLAKSQLYGTPGPWAGRLWWDWIVPLRMGDLPQIGELNMMLPLAVVMAAAAVLGTRAAWEARRTGLAALIAGAGVIWAGYAALGVAWFYWYFLVPLTAVAALAAAGLPRLARGRALYVSLLLYIVGAWSISRFLYLGRAKNEALDFGRVANYLAANAQPGQTVMLEPIGLVGYTCPLRVIDEVGLVTPALARRRLEGAGWYADVVLGERPEWLVVRRGVLITQSSFAGAGAPFRSQAERDSMLSHYALADRGSGLSGENTLVILKRKR